VYTVKEKGENPDRKPYFLPHGLRNAYRNLKSENSQDYAHKPQRNCTFMNLASALENFSLLIRDKGKTHRILRNIF
jgi:hypothetical protein